MINEIYKDRVLIKIDSSSEEETDYLVPQNHEEEEKLSGEVFGIGKEVTDTAIGDIVVFGQYDYSKVLIEGTEYILTKEENLICKLIENE